MNRRTYLGEFEHLVLLAVLTLGDEAHGTAIREELAARADRDVTRSAAYITLERLVTKGYLQARMGESSGKRGGRAKRLFAMTTAGREALQESGRALMRMWAGHESLLEEVDGMRRELGDLQERVDFTERLMARGKDQWRLEGGSDVQK